ncbi:hypothetical protein [uncultured Enterococcus sp.]|uniref:hypothetical protein n=1 Tax=uncultured Enterococcus sp. TaxID=167972 RepID=UPI0028ED2138|nr:hypothetical protein [uncultured Enterococcus sp.]
MANSKCMLSVVMNSGVVYQVSFDDQKVAKKAKDEWISALETFNITYTDGSIINVNKKFVESINLTPINRSHISTSTERVLKELSNEHIEQMRINSIGSKLQDIVYAIDRSSR